MSMFEGLMEDMVVDLHRTLQHEDDGARFVYDLCFNTIALIGRELDDVGYISFRTIADLRAMKAAQERLTDEPGYAMCSTCNWAYLETEGPHMFCAIATQPNSGINPSIIEFGWPLWRQPKESVAFAT